jgi:hypothetical protein
MSNVSDIGIAGLQWLHAVEEPINHERLVLCWAKSISKWDSMSSRRVMQNNRLFPNCSMAWRFSSGNDIPPELKSAPAPRKNTVLQDGVSDRLPDLQSTGQEMPAPLASRNERSNQAVLLADPNMRIHPHKQAYCNISRNGGKWIAFLGKIVPVELAIATSFSFGRIVAHVDFA